MAKEMITVLGRLPATITPNETDKAYAAGFFDGEGNVCIAFAGRAGKDGKYHSFNVRVGVAQCDPGPLMWLRDRWAGSIRAAKRGPCNYFSWGCFSRMSVVFLRDVLPYLQVKRERALLAISFQETIFQPGRRAHSAEHRARLGAMKAEMNRLNAI